jgi:hypothetical protein
MINGGQSFVKWTAGLSGAPLYQFTVEGTG